MALTTQQKLDQVQTAISNIESGLQAYSADGRSGQRPNLETLYKERTRLEGLLARESCGGGGGLGYVVPM